jgi:hypothetical protein
MPELIADPPVSPCYCLLSKAEFVEFQWVGPDLFFPRARARLRGGRDKPGQAGRDAQGRAAWRENETVPQMQSKWAKRSPTPRPW